MKTIQVLSKEHGHPVSPELFGIFFEDINFGCDGGLNANMVKNYSFDGVFLNAEGMCAESDPLRYWILDGGSLASGSEGALHENSKYGLMQVEGKAVLSNLGYNGEKAHKEEGAMSIKEGHEYLFEAYVRNDGYAGTLKVVITDLQGNALTEAGEVAVDAKEWTKVSVSVKGLVNAYGKLNLIFEGNGALALDCVSFMDSDYWNAGDPKWRHGKFRKDLIQALADMKPKFMRFPGGCIVEGLFAGNEYDWKDTVGELYERKTDYCLWAEQVPDGGYNQSYQIGFYEYFCLCEDLGMKPLPTLTVGLNCQVRSDSRGEAECPNTPIDSEEFKTYIIDNYLDLIDFAKADPETNKWGALRARMGHPAPFELDRIGIGNENYKEVYFERFDLIEKAIHEKYPEMLCILCGGLHPYPFEMNGCAGIPTYYEIAGKYNNVLVDEHSYHTPEWFEAQSTRFDSYDRNGAGVYFGEYAANLLMKSVEAAGVGIEDEEERRKAMELAQSKMATDYDKADGMRPMNRSNMLDTALGEAAFITGLERNSDIVKMSSYAPLFNLIDSDQWNHNLINFNPATLCRTLNYYVQKMAGNYIGTHTLPVETELPEHVYMSVTEDEDHVYMKLVNTGKESYQFAVQLPYACGEACGEALGHERLDVRNDIQFTGDAVYELEPKAICGQANGTEFAVDAAPQTASAWKIKKVK